MEKNRIDKVSGFPVNGKLEVIFEGVGHLFFGEVGIGEWESGGFEKSFSDAHMYKIPENI
ncbi:TPA: hypothetical protein HA338_15345 [Methanosarcina acetivorans]|uniref:Uncharacterized protein n=1 Tax=Methanosarcina acetivorans TaxID=2214 RepID=A0A832SBJ2_9EURY|nr:hypothetical protein [Methanosarcina acetivorans]HIH95333.1 hypothetical protein [Methanosarcina acetivorans]